MNFLKKLVNTFDKHIEKKQTTDMMNREITLLKHPQRIISLVPSQTELLYNLGLGDSVVGITKFCIHPTQWFQSKRRVGGTKSIDFEKISALNPDLIIGNKEENEESQIRKLMETYPVWISDIETYSEALQMIDLVGKLVDKKKESQELLRQIKANFSKITPFSKKQSVLYLIWKKPYISVGKATFIHQMLTKIGLENCTKSIENNRYPELSETEIKNLNPSYIFLSSEPYPFKKKHIKELKLLCPNAIIKLVDGTYFSWYGSRLKDAPTYFNELIGQL